MKIEIDLNDILGSEYESETLADSVKRQIVEKLSSEVKREMAPQITKAIYECITNETQDAIRRVVESGLDEEYKVCDKYGKEEGVTTLRAKIREAVATAVTYNPAGRYSSDKNGFTQAIDSAVSVLVKEATEVVHTKLDYEFKKKVLDDAVEHIKTSLKI